VAPGPSGISAACGAVRAQWGSRGGGAPSAAHGGGWRGYRRGRARPAL